ncbi:MAG: hypothetical protein E7553_03535 [Ruminococcaceae bacterium]|nr:hypothetical protein [Oscillospiraceae bacterium]
MKKCLCVMITVLCLAVCLCACSETEQPKNDPVTTTTVATTTTTQPQAATFEVKVVDQNGAPVQGVMIQICKDICVPKMSDGNGIALFDLEIEDGHKLSVLSCPAGYTYTGEAEVYLESGSTSYTVELQGEA